MRFYIEYKKIISVLCNKIFIYRVLEQANESKLKGLKRTIKSDSNIDFLCV